MHLVALELEGVGQVVELAVDQGAGKALVGQVLEEGVVGALAAVDHGGEDLEAGALLQLHDPVDDLLRRLPGDRRAVVGTVRDADAGEEQPEVVVDLGDGADRGAGVSAGRLLVDGDGRRQALDEVDVGLVHLPEELAGVGGKRFDVAPLALGVDGVEGQRALARPGQTGEHDELVAGQLEVDALEVVFACSLHHQRVGHVERLAARCDREGEHTFDITLGTPTGPFTLRPVAKPSSVQTSAGLDPDRLAFGLTIITLALLPLITGPVLWAPAGGHNDINQRVSASPYDLPLVLLVVVCVADVLERRTWTGRWERVTVLAAATVGWCLVSSAVHPSWRALDWFVHLLGAWAIVRTVRRADPHHQNVFLAVVTALGAAEAALGVAQSLHGSILGLGPLEWHADMVEFGSATAGRGSLTHPYYLAALLMTCIGAALVLVRRLPHGRWRLLAGVAVGVMAVALPLTFSRAALVCPHPDDRADLVRKPIRRAAIPALLAGLLIGGVLAGGGLATKAERSIDVKRVDSGRRVRLEEAARLVAQDPVFGVGPGRYVIALRNVEHERLLPAHDIVAQAAAEAGLPAAVLLSVTLGLFGVWVIEARRSRGDHCDLPRPLPPARCLPAHQPDRHRRLRALARHPVAGD